MLKTLHPTLHSLLQDLAWQFLRLVAGSRVGCAHMGAQQCVQLTCLLAVCMTQPKVSWGESSLFQRGVEGPATGGGVLLNSGVSQHHCRSWTADSLLRVQAEIMIFISWWESSLFQRGVEGPATGGGVLLNSGVSQHHCRSWTADSLLREQAEIMIFISWWQ